MKINNTNTILQNVIQVNLLDLYYIKLHKTLEIGLSIKKFIPCHISNLSIDDNNCIHHFNQL